MKIMLKPKYHLHMLPHWLGYNTIHSATEWALEQDETKRYVEQVCHDLMNGGSITESTLGMLADDRISTEERNEILNKKLNQRLEARLTKWRLAEELEQERLLAQHKAQKQLRAQRKAQKSERKKWESEMRSYQGRWSKQDKLSDETTLLLFRRDLRESTTGLYIRVQGHRVDAGTFDDAGSHMKDACFNKFWGRKFRNENAAVKFVMWRAMGVKYGS